LDFDFGFYTCLLGFLFGFYPSFSLVAPLTKGKSILEKRLGNQKGEIIRWSGQALEQKSGGKATEI